MFVLESSAFRNNHRIPRVHSCDGDDQPPPLSWRGAPPGTKSFALVCDDPDAPGGTFFHWGIWDIPSEWIGLAKDLKRHPAGRAIGEAMNGFGKSGYSGPCPPKGDGIHHYHFRLFALGVEHLPLIGAVGCKAVAGTAEAHAIATAELIGLYER